MTEYKLRILQNPEDESEINLRTYLKSVSLDETWIQALENLKERQKIYIFSKALDWDSLCLMTNILIRKGVIPELIFMWSDDRKTFFKHFYNGTVIINNTEYPFCETESGSYLISDFDKSPQNAFNGIRDRFRLTGVLDNRKIILKSRLFRDMTTASSSNVVIYIKTISRESALGSVAEYYDYEDKFPEYGQEKPMILFVFDKTGLPRPEKIATSPYDLLPFVNSLSLPEICIVNEKELGIPEIEFHGIDYNFFKNLSLREKNEFTKLFINLIWKKFVNGEDLLIKPDVWEREKFSRDGNKRVYLMELFGRVDLILELYKAYKHTVLTETNFGKNPGIVFNVDEISKMVGEDSVKVFVPKVELFNDVFSFIFAKEMFYKRLSELDYKGLLNNIKQIALQSSQRLGVLERDTLEDTSYEEKIGMEEQYGKESLVEIDCKKIILRTDKRKVCVFIPLSSKINLNEVIRNNKKTKLKYVDLKPGDEFEREYWSYGRLITTLRSRPEILTNYPNVKDNIEISEKFRMALKSYLSNNDRDKIVKEIENSLLASGIKKNTNYYTIVSWVDNIMAPQLVEVVNVLNELFRSSLEGYDVNVDQFINACKDIKSMRSVISENDEEREDRTIKFVVESVSQDLFKVRGENVGKFFTIA